MLNRNGPTTPAMIRDEFGVSLGRTHRGLAWGAVKTAKTMGIMEYGPNAPRREFTVPFPAHNARRVREVRAAVFALAFGG